MKTRTKAAILIAVVLIVLGSVIAFLGFRGMSFRFGALNTDELISSTFDITEDFHHISIHVDSTDLYFAASEDGLCRVECEDFSGESYTAAVENHTLTVTKSSNRPWYGNISFVRIGEPRVTMYLPQEEYASLQITGSTSDVEMPETFSFDQATIHTSTGDIHWLAAVQDTLSITTDTGDINVNGTAPQSLMTVADTGDVALSSVECVRLSMESDTGDITLKHIVVTETLTIHSDTGDVVFDHSDAGEIFVQTNTGDVTGTLDSAKIFFTETDTGNVDVPRSTSGGTCEIITNTGDISLRIAQ